MSVYLRTCLHCSASPVRGLARPPLLPLIWHLDIQLDLTLSCVFQLHFSHWPLSLLLPCLILQNTYHSHMEARCYFIRSLALKVSVDSKSSWESSNYSTSSHDGDKEDLRSVACFSRLILFILGRTHSRWLFLQSHINGWDRESLQSPVSGTDIRKTLAGRPKRGRLRL